MNFAINSAMSVYRKNISFNALKKDNVSDSAVNNLVQKESSVSVTDLRYSESLGYMNTSNESYFAVLPEPDIEQKEDAKEIQLRAKEVALRAKKEYNEALFAVEDIEPSTDEMQKHGYVGKDGAYRTIYFHKNAYGKKVIDKVRSDNSRATNDVFQFEQYPNGEVYAIKALLNTQPDMDNSNIMETEEEFVINLQDDSIQVESYGLNTKKWDSGKMLSADKILRFNPKGKLHLYGKHYYATKYSQLYCFADAITGFDSHN